MKNNKDNIYVTRPYLPSLKKFEGYLKDIWESKWLTNQGKYHEKLEKALAEYLNVKHVSLFSNGTLALICALQVLRISGEVITTPYSFVATTHALYWNGITPVFCDIESQTTNIDPEKIEVLITPKTTAILPVHVYGYPCHLEEIEKIADIYGLKVIYHSCGSVFDIIPDLIKIGVDAIHPIQALATNMNVETLKKHFFNQISSLNSLFI